eukprot:2551185-Lingulodinium_polyedra.AAC.1
MGMAMAMTTTASTTTTTTITYLRIANTKSLASGPPWFTPLRSICWANSTIINRCKRGETAWNSALNARTK